MLRVLRPEINPPKKRDFQDKHYEHDKTRKYPEDQLQVDRADFIGFIERINTDHQADRGVRERGPHERIKKLFTLVDDVKNDNENMRRKGHEKE